MITGYCIKCKAKKEMKDTQLSYYKNGTPVEKGKCADCGSGMCRILTKEERAVLLTGKNPVE